MPTTTVGPVNWTLEDLVDAERNGESLEFILFWGHTPPSSGEIGPHVFSQWWKQDFEEDGVTYPTAEHFIMAEKARLFDDEDALAKILGSDSPKDAKAAGRGVRGFDTDTWEQHRFDIVRRASLAKFGSDESMRSYLLSTDKMVIVEASPNDSIWGIGAGRDDPSCKKPSQWQGLNLLGFALMQARAVLRN